jgi:succinyl-diaminopimelate desuccinylase
MIPFLQEILRLESRTYAEAALATRVVQEMQQQHFDAAWIDQTGNALGLVQGRERGAATMLLTHLDHIDVGDTALWEHPPFAGVLEQGRLHGRGAVDIKGPLAAQLFALAGLLKIGLRPKHDVLLAVPVEEEVGGRGMAELMAKLPLETPLGLLEIAACVVGEPSGNQIMLGHRGRCCCTVRFHGRAHHASLGLHAENPHFAYGVFLERLKQLELPNHPILGSSSISPTTIQADTSSDNLTPNTITLTLDWRTTTEDGADVKRILEQLLKNSPATFVSYDNWASDIAGFITEANHGLVTALHSTRDELLGQSKTRIWQFATDGRWAHKVGIACVGFGPGAEELAHTTKESIAVQQLEDHVKVLQKFLLEY